MNLDSNKLTTAIVPDELQPLFTRAEDVVGEFFKNKIVDPPTAKIEISGERYLMVRAGSLMSSLINLTLEANGDQTKRDALRSVMHDIGRMLGYTDAATIAFKTNLKDPLARIAVGPVLFAFTGWAQVRFMPGSKPLPNEDCYIIYDHVYSFESHEWMKTEHKSQDAMCIMNSGYAAGWASSCFGIPLVVVEVACKAKGDTSDRFIMAHPSKIKQFVLEYYKTHEIEVDESKVIPGYLTDFIETYKKTGNVTIGPNISIIERYLAGTRELEKAREMMKDGLKNNLD